MRSLASLATRSAARAGGVFVIAATMSCGPSTQPTDGSPPIDVADVRADMPTMTDVPTPDAPMAFDAADSSFDVVNDETGADQNSIDVVTVDTADALDEGDDGSTLDADADAETPDADDAPTDGSSGVVVRIVAGNLTSGTAQSYTPGEGIRIFQGLRPDVALIQEFNYGGNTTSEIRAFVDAAFGTTYEFVRGTGMLPNGVASRYPIASSGEWIDALVTNRTFVWARIDVPGPRDLWAVSIHLLTSGATTRDSESMSLARQVESNVPGGDLLVVGGDFNTDTRTEPCIATLGSVLSTAPPYPADPLGNSNTNAPRTRPYDWVLANSDLRTFEIPVVIGANAFPSGLVFDTRVYTPLADVAPALLGDSAAAGMQHMAVVRDFRIP